MTNAIRLGVVLIMTLMLVPGCSEDSSPASPDRPAQQEFVAYRGSSSILYVVRPDGTGLRILTSTIPSVERLLWSVDGKTLFFTSNALGQSGFFSVLYDGTQLNNFASGYYAYYIDRSPVASLVAFGAPHCCIEPCYIWTCDEQAGGMAKLARGDGPHFSPNGTLIAFHRGDSLLTMEVNGQNQTYLCQASGALVDGRHFWSESGDELVFARYMDGAGGNYDIFTIGRNGTAETRLTTDPLFDGFAEWAPGDSLISFWRGQVAVSWDLYLIKPDGTGERKLLENACTWEYPRGCWSPDGKQIAFCTDTSIAIVDISTGQHRTVVPFDQRYTEIDWVRVAK